jgi:hypothetical protein
LILDQGQGVESFLDPLDSPCAVDPLLDHRLLASVIVPVHFLVENHQEQLEFVLNLVVAILVYQVFESHEKCELACCARKPNVVDLFGKFSFISLYIPVVKCMAYVYWLVLGCW